MILKKMQLRFTFSAQNMTIIPIFSSEDLFLALQLFLMLGKCVFLNTFLNYAENVVVMIFSWISPWITEDLKFYSLAKQSNECVLTEHGLTCVWMKLIRWLQFVSITKNWPHSLMKHFEKQKIFFCSISTTGEYYWMIRDL